MPHKQHQEERPLQSECVKIIVLELNEEELRKREEAKKKFEASIQRFYKSAQNEELGIPITYRPKITVSKKTFSVQHKNSTSNVNALRLRLRFRGLSLTSD